MALVPESRTTAVMLTVLAESRKAPPPEVVVKLMVRFVGDVAGLPATSCISTVIELEATPAVNVWGGVVMTSLVGVPGLMLKATELVPVTPTAVAASV